MNIERAPEPSAPHDKEDAFASWRARQQQTEAARANEPELGISDEKPLSATLREMAREADAANRASGYIPRRHRPTYRAEEPSLFRRSGTGLGRTALVIFLAGAATLATGSAATDANYGAAKATEFLEQSGYTDVEHENTDMFLIGKRGCGRDDSVMYEFDATAANGDNVEMIVCKGFFKGATIRQG
jgi:hypothetical protein